MITIDKLSRKEFYGNNKTLLDKTVEYILVKLTNSLITLKQIELMIMSYHINFFEKQYPMLLRIDVMIVKTQ